MAGGVLVVAESYTSRLTALDISKDSTLANRHTWAAFDESAPDGICADGTGAILFADVGDRRCVRVGEGGVVLATVEVVRGCLDCAVGGLGGGTLYVAAAVIPDVFAGPGSGRLLAVAIDPAGVPVRPTSPPVTLEDLNHVPAPWRCPR